MDHHDDRGHHQHLLVYYYHDHSHNGIVKTTNKRSVNTEPLHTVTFSGLVRREREVETALTEMSESASSRLGVCPWVVALDKAGQNQHVHVHFFNMSTKAITVSPIPHHVNFKK